MNKKAVSPLVATILLIAFAVSIGAVIMNWTSTSTGVGSHSEEGECARVSVSVMDKDGSKAICLDREKKQILINIENGKEDILGLRVSYIGDESNYKDIHENVEAGVFAKLPINYDPAIEGELLSVKITPIAGEAREYIYCTESGEKFQNIADCE